MYYSKVSRDKNHIAIQKAIKKLGCTVVDLAAVGRGCPDILVGIEGKTNRYNLLFEIKSIKGRLRKGQKEFHEQWAGKVAVIRTVEEAVYICNHYKQL